MIKHKLLIIFLLFAIAFIQLLALPARTIHIDEGMGIRAAELMLSGNYKYSPYNGHGPTLFLMGSLIRNGFGTNILFFRALTAFFMLFSLSILWLIYRAELKNIGVILLLAGLGFSSGMLFFSAYFIHESLFILLTILTLASIERFFKTKKGLWLAFFVPCFSLMYMTKETALFTYAAWFIAGMAVLIFNKSFKKSKELLTIKNALFLILGFVLSIVLYFLLFGKSLDLFKSPLLWLVERGAKMHIRPWYYFIVLLILHESFLLVSGAVAAFFLTIKKQWKLKQLFFFLWFLAILILYSAIPYKTPWLILNIILPLGIFIAFGFSEIYKKANKILLISFFIVLFLISLTCLYCDNFLHPDRAKTYDYAYLQSGNGLNEFINIIEGISVLDQKEPLKIQIIGNGDELLYVLTEKYNRSYEPFIPGLPVYINYLHSAQEMKKLLSGTGQKYVFLKFTYFTPGPEINLFIREDKWNAYKSSSDFIKPKTVLPNGAMLYD